MKRKCLLVCFVFCLISLLVVTAFAHPGRTDSNGGHTDHSTGEYHYHHGYSAHDHYDMDGDGDIDCPYGFHDKTDHSSGDSVVSTEEPVVEPHSEVNSVEKTISAEDRITFGEVLKAMFEALLPAIASSMVAAYLLSFLLLPLFGDDRGCFIALVLWGIIFIVAYILLILVGLNLI